MMSAISPHSLWVFGLLSVIILAFIPEKEVQFIAMADRSISEAKPVTYLLQLNISINVSFCFRRNCIGD